MSRYEQRAQELRDAQIEAARDKRRQLEEEYDEAVSWANKPDRSVKVGDRIELVHTSDPYTKMKPGERGTVTLIDALGTTHVDWDCGSSLGLIEGEDQWKKIDKEVT